mmetsp:Transcript_13437/g.25565  ORF Transcript_13437/g.25565 Transcript_13437/m.25565 type:complete len:95 (+) Transcript_13437:2297-2581(+)
MQYPRKLALADPCSKRALKKVFIPKFQKLVDLHVNLLCTFSPWVEGKLRSGGGSKNAYNLFSMTRLNLRPLKQLPSSQAMGSLEHVGEDTVTTE